MPEDPPSRSGPHGRSFPTTHWSLVLAAADGGNPDRRKALDVLCRRYWPAVYSYMRSVGQGSDAARDLTQGFFARLLEKGDLEQADRTRGKFRSFLLASAKHYLANEWDRAHAQRRGGGGSVFSLDVEDAEARYGMHLAASQTPETIYEKHWARTLVAHALARLENEMASSKHARQFGRFRPFMTFEGGVASYRDLAREIGASETAIKVAIHRMRRRFGVLLREEVAHTLHDPSAAEVDDEVRHLLSVMES